MRRDIFITKLEEIGVDTRGALDRFMGDKDMYIRFVLRTNSMLRLDLMHYAIEDDDADAFYEAAMGIRGTASNLGLLPVVETLDDALVEFRSSRLRNPEKMQGLVHEMDEFLQKLTQLIRDYSNSLYTAS